MGNVTLKPRKIHEIFSCECAPNVSTLRRVINKFEETWSVMDRKSSVRRHTCRSLENIAAVNDSVAQNPRISIRHQSQQLQISRSITQRILRNDLWPSADHAQRWRAFSSDWVRQQTKLSNLGLKKSTQDPWKPDAPTTCNCLGRILVRRRDWALLLWKWSRKSSSHKWHSLQKHDNGVIVTSTRWYGSNRHMISAGRRHL